MGRRANLWAVAVSLLAVAGCASTTTTAAPRQAATGNQQAGSAVSGSVDPDCTKASKVTIVETASGTYSFSPSKLKIQRGAFLAITNKSDEIHALISKPDAGIVTSVLDLKERQVIQFPKAGTFTVESESTAHRAVLQLTVSGESGCGASEPTLTIANGYSFAPAKLTVAATANFAVVNRSNAAQTVVCAPDPGGNKDNSRLERGETQLLAIDKPGQYACTSTEHPSAKVTITVR